MSTIGPTFAKELAAAGLTGLPFSWSASGLENTDALTSAQLDAVKAVLAAHDPHARLPRTLDALAFHTALDEQGHYPAFRAWLNTQPDATVIYFDKAQCFSESDPRVVAATAAVSTTPDAFYTKALA